MTTINILAWKDFQIGNLKASIKTRSCLISHVSLQKSSPNENMFVSREEQSKNRSNMQAFKLNLVIDSSFIHKATDKHWNIHNHDLEQWNRTAEPTWWGPREHLLCNRCETTEKMLYLPWDTHDQSASSECVSVCNRTAENQLSDLWNHVLWWCDWSCLYFWPKPQFCCRSTLAAYRSSRQGVEEARQRDDGKGEVWLVGWVGAS